MVLQHAVMDTVDEEAVEVEERGERAEEEDRQEPSSSTVPKKRKSLSKKQQYNAELTECILNLAEKEDHQVDLELAAIGARIKRKLNSEETDDILDEIKEVTKSFFNRKRQRQASVSVQPAVCTAQPVMAPPPPLMRQPQTQMQQEEQGGPDVLFDLSGMPPLQGYDVQYMRDASNNNTYMKLN